MIKKNHLGASPVQSSAADHHDEQLDAPRQLSSEELAAVAGGPQFTNDGDGMTDQSGTETP